MSAAARIVAVAVTVCVGLAGCNQQQQKAPDVGKGGEIRMAKGPGNGKHAFKECKKNGNDECDITIAGTVDATTGKADIAVAADDWVAYTKANSAAFTWNLTGTNFRFAQATDNPPATGIDFGSAATGSSPPVVCNPSDATSTSIKCTVKKPAKFEGYKYTINVVYSTDGTKLILDPWVVGD